MIEWAEVVPGSEQPVGVGVSGAARCTLRVQGRVVGGILKRIPRDHVMAEAFCALLLRGWGLSVPTPYLVADGDALAFASADVGYPNLMQRLGVDALQKGTQEHKAAIKLAALVAARLPSAALAAVADEAVDNRDRNLGNILWDGATEAWIDHVLTLGHGASLQDANHLCAMAIAVGDAERLQHAAIAAWTALDRSLAQQAAAGLADAADMTQQAAFVADRLNTLGARLLARFPAPDDLLSGA